MARRAPETSTQFALNALCLMGCNLVPTRYLICCSSGRKENTAPIESEEDMHFEAFCARREVGPCGRSLGGCQEGRVMLREGGGRDECFGHFGLDN